MVKQSRSKREVSRSIRGGPTIFKRRNEMITQEEDKIMDRSMLFYYLKRWMETNTLNDKESEDVNAWFLTQGYNELKQLWSNALHEVTEDKKK